MIKNRRIFGNSIIINGRCINSYNSKEGKEIDELKIEDAEKIENITINSDCADISVVKYDSSKIEVHCYGNGKGNFKFETEVKNQELRISLEIKGNFYGDLNLDVKVPNKKFKKIYASATSADINVDSNIFSNNICLKTMSGDVRAKANFKEASIETMSGDVYLYLKAENDVDIKISSMSGDISIQFDNIDNLDIDTSTLSGDVKNRHHNQKGYKANGIVTTLSGDIKII